MDGSLSPQPILLVIAGAILVLAVIMILIVRLYRSLPRISRSPEEGTRNLGATLEYLDRFASREGRATVQYFKKAGLIVLLFGAAVAVCVLVMYLITSVL